MFRRDAQAADMAFSEENRAPADVQIVTEEAGASEEIEQTVEE